MNIVCSPYVGEFGWSLFCWQGYLRHLAQQDNRLFVNCESGTELLYQDFAEEITTWSCSGSIRDMWRNRDWRYAETPHKYLEFRNLPKTDGYSIIKNNTYQTRNWSTVGSAFFKDQTWIPFVDDTPHEGYLFDVLIHARNLYKYNTQYRNWKLGDLEQYVNEVTKLGYKIAFVGLQTESISIAGIPNFQNIPLSRLAQIFKRSKMIVGPLSGITHFATLCKLPQVSWVTKGEHKQRLEQTWNPFGVPVDVLYSGTDTHWKNKTYWLPDVTELVNATKRMGYL